MTEPFKPSPTDIQNLQTIRRAINRTAYHGGLGIRESGKMLGTMDRLLASFGIGGDDHGELEDDDPLKDVQAQTVDKLAVYERAVASLASSGQRRHEGDNCSCPTPVTCPYCSRMYPCDCAGCPSRKVTKSDLLNIDPTSITVSFVDEEHLLDKSCRVFCNTCKTCKERPVATFDRGTWDECAICYSKGYGK